MGSAWAVVRDVGRDHIKPGCLVQLCGVDRLKPNSFQGLHSVVQELSLALGAWGADVAAGGA